MHTFGVLFITLIIGFSLIIPTKVQAQQTRLNIMSGWFLSVGLGAVNIETEAMTQEKINAYDEAPEKESALLIWPMLNLTYIDDNGGQWFLGTIDETIGIERRQPTPLGLFTVSYGVGYYDILRLEIKGQEYENPYELGVNRDTTTTNIIKKKLSYSFGRGINFTFNYHQDEIFYEDDKTSEISNDLGRDAQIDIMSVHLRLFFLSIGREEQTQLASGKADSYDGIFNVYSIFIPLFSSNILLEAYSKSGTNKYEKEHPVFSKTREDKITKKQLQLNLTFNTWTVFLLYYDDHIDSNIDFFDEKETMQGIGASYLF